MHCFKNQKYKLLKSAMVCLMMGAAFVSTDGVLSATFAAEEVTEENDSISRVRQLQTEIAEKHPAFVYSKMVYNTDTPKSETRTFGFVVHEVASKLESNAEINKFLSAMKDPENGKLLQAAYEIIKFYHGDVIDKIDDSKNLLEDIARNFYAMSAFSDLLEAALSYKNTIKNIVVLNQVELDVAKDVQTNVIQAAMEEKDVAISSAKETFEKSKKEAEESCKVLCEEKEGTIGRLKGINQKLTQGGGIPPQSVTTNNKTIQKLTEEVRKSSQERDSKIKEAEKLRDEALVAADKKFNEAKLKQDELIKKAELKLKNGTQNLESAFAWFVEPIGGGYGGKTLVRAVSRQHQKRSMYDYHLFNEELAKNAKIREDSRLEIVKKFVGSKATKDFLFLCGIEPKDLRLLKERAKSERENLMSHLANVSAKDGDKTQKKSSK